MSKYPIIWGKSIEVSRPHFHELVGPGIESEKEQNRPSLCWVRRSFLTLVFFVNKQFFSFPQGHFCLLFNTSMLHFVIPSLSKLNQLVSLQLYPWPLFVRLLCHHIFVYSEHLIFLDSKLVRMIKYGQRQFKCITFCHISSFYS